MGENVKILRQETDRIAFIDVAKGIGILLVVFGHIVSLHSAAEYSIYSFHMPLFFILSGLFANADRYDFKPYIARKTKQLLIPYLICFFVGLIISIMIPGWFEINAVETVYSFMSYSVFSPGDVNVGPIWFLMCLYIVSFVFYPIYKLIYIKNNPVYNALTICISVLISFTIPRIFVVPGHFFPFCLDIVPMALAFYSIGFLFRKYILNIEKYVAYRWIIMLICLFQIILLPNAFTKLIGMVNNNYGPDLFLFFVCAGCGTVLVLLSATYLKKSKLLAYIGKNSLLIFAFHSIFVRLYSMLLSYIFKENLTAQVNLDFLQTIIGFIAVTLVTLGFVLIYNIIKKKLLYLVKKKSQ